MKLSLEDLIKILTHVVGIQASMWFWRWLLL